MDKMGLDLSKLRQTCAQHFEVLLTPRVFQQSEMFLFTAF